MQEGVHLLGPFLTKRVISIDSGEEFCQIASHKAVEIVSMQNEVTGVPNVVPFPSSLLLL